MVTVEQVLRKKGSLVHGVISNATVQEAAQMMNEHQIGALVVIDAGEVVGMFTERDVLRWAREQPASAGDTKVRQWMSYPVICCRPDTQVDHARHILMQRRIRHLPVIDREKRLHGLVSIGDLNAWEIDGQALELHYLHEYIHGRG